MSDFTGYSNMPTAAAVASAAAPNNTLQDKQCRLVAIDPLGGVNLAQAGDVAIGVIATARGGIGGTVPPELAKGLAACSVGVNHHPGAKVTLHTVDPAILAGAELTTGADGMVVPGNAPCVAIACGKSQIVFDTDGVTPLRGCVEAILKLECS